MLIVLLVVIIFLPILILLLNRLALKLSNSLYWTVWLRPGLTFLPILLASYIFSHSKNDNGYYWLLRSKGIADFNLDLVVYFDLLTLIAILLVSLLSGVYFLSRTKSNSETDDQSSKVLLLQFSLNLFLLSGNLLMFISSWFLVGAITYLVFRVETKSPTELKHERWLFGIIRSSDFFLLLGMVGVLATIGEAMIGDLVKEKLGSSLSNYSQLFYSTLLICFAIGLKTAQVPFSFWPMDKIKSSDPMFMILACVGILLPGVFFTSRVSFLMNHFSTLREIMVFWGVLTSCWSGLMGCFNQSEENTYKYLVLLQFGLVFSFIGLGHFAYAFFHCVIFFLLFAALLLFRKLSSLNRLNQHSTHKKRLMIVWGVICALLCVPFLPTNFPFLTIVWTLFSSGNAKFHFLTFLYLLNYSLFTFGITKYFIQNFMEKTKDVDSSAKELKLLNAYLVSVTFLILTSLAVGVLSTPTFINRNAWTYLEKWTKNNLHLYSYLDLNQNQGWLTMGLLSSLCAVLISLIYYKNKISLSKLDKVSKLFLHFSIFQEKKLYKVGNGTLVIALFEWPAQIVQTSTKFFIEGVLVERAFNGLKIILLEISFFLKQVGPTEFKRNVLYYLLILTIVLAILCKIVLEG